MVTLSSPRLPVARRRPRCLGSCTRAAPGNAPVYLAEGKGGLGPAEEPARVERRRGGAALGADFAELVTALPFTLIIAVCVALYRELCSLDLTKRAKDRFD